MAAAHTAQVGVSGTSTCSNNLDTTTTSVTTAPATNASTSTSGTTSDSTPTPTPTFANPSITVISDTNPSLPAREEFTPSFGLHSHRQNHSSSKLPAFRFADLKHGVSSLPPTHQPLHLVLAHQIPPSPVSPPSAPDGSSGLESALVAAREPLSTTHRADDQAATASGTPSVSTTAASTATVPVAATHDSPPRVSAQPPTPPPPSSTGTSAAASASASASAEAPSSRLERSASYPESSTTVASRPAASAILTQNRRILPKRTFSGTFRSGARALALDTQRSYVGDSSTAAQPSPGQRELILPKTLSQFSPPDDRRMSSHRPPPVSYRAPASSSSAQPSPTTPVRVPPIRAFRSSGSRKSLVLDMNFARSFDVGDETPDPNHDRALRALEGRRDPDVVQMTPPVSARQDAPDADDTGDVFLKIAREESSRRIFDMNNLPDTSTASRVRSQHRRPLSTNVATYHPTSPPRLSRRLSDQQETSRTRQSEEERATEVSRITNYRSLAREKAASIFPGEDLIRTRPVGTGLRTTPSTPRTAASYDFNPEPFVYQRRQPSISESSAPPPARSSTFTFRSPISTVSQSKAHSSSPLVRSFEQGQSHSHSHSQSQSQSQSQAPEASAPGLEGTESTASNTAPSTVWDELDDLKSRIHRLELTGKLPATSGAAVSRMTDERPPTATTTATTMSSSPKRSVPGAAQATEVASTTSSSHHREGHPILMSALAKSKPFLNPEVYRALESAAHDAMALSSLMGTPGQPGPISSGASAIGSGTNITDRQLRRKADSVCRSLTELCVALGEDVTKQAPPPPAQPTQPSLPPPADPVTPTVPKPINTAIAQRRQSVTGDSELAKGLLSPRAISKFEERRNNLLNGSALTSPRVINTNSTPATPNDSNSNRRSSLLVARSRRAGTEEPEDGRKSSILRTRRAGTEEPDEGRKTSLLVRGRRGTVGEDEDDVRFRTPSRANTEVHGMRSVTREYFSQPPPAFSQQQAQAQAQAAEATTQVASTIPRRRFASSSTYTSRLATPGSSLAAPSPARRYLERSVERSVERDSGNTADSEDRTLRAAPSGMLSRAGSLNRRQNRDSTLTTVSTAATAGGYR
ncbi:hypothetical protein B0I35DRAFT_37780 [Stachybotrys elegans]|uniref:LPXTG-motif cell wall anchor domain protein n=1 Tax=Stachybotrys elegans TaxID=80388 RepID=A0A8K0T6U1_9HYPO|nr:hypothetical protein B0I35DRAFT_37780 [Stachybotrys elegans]